MSQKPKYFVPIEHRPKAVEKILREGRGENPGTWVKWRDIHEAVGGSERELGPMIKAAKDRIVAEEAAMAHLPELPADLQSECERFVMEVWRKSCEFNDANASAERRRRQSDLERFEDERREHEEMLAAVSEDRDRLLGQVEAHKAALERCKVALAEKEEAFVEERRLRSAAEAASNELRQLFESLRGAAALGTDDRVGEKDTETNKEDAKPNSAPAKRSRKAASSKAPSEPTQEDDDDPEPPSLPLGLNQ